MAYQQIMQGPFNANYCVAKSVPSIYIKCYSVGVWVVMFCLSPYTQDVCPPLGHGGRGGLGGRGVHGGHGGHGRLGSNGGHGGHF